MLEITPKSKINALLNTYPELEAYLMTLHPKYKNLKNPVLRRTIGRIATLTQVSKIGGFDTLELVNLLRKKVGQNPLLNEKIDTMKISSSIPDAQPKAVLDVTKILDEGANPLKLAHKELSSLPSGAVIVLESDFEPAPLIDTLQKEGHQLSMVQKGDLYQTYIVKA